MVNYILFLLCWQLNLDFLIVEYSEKYIVLIYICFDLFYILSLLFLNYFFFQMINIYYIKCVKYLLCFKLYKLIFVYCMYIL